MLIFYFILVFLVGAVLGRCCKLLYVDRKSTLLERFPIAHLRQTPRVEIEISCRRRSVKQRFKLDLGSAFSQIRKQDVLDFEIKTRDCRIDKPARLRLADDSARETEEFEWKELELHFGGRRFWVPFFVIDQEVPGMIGRYGFLKYVSVKMTTAEVQLFPSRGGQQVHTYAREVFERFRRPR